jgi:hypothetical protein
MFLEGEGLDGPIETMASRASDHGTFKRSAGRVHDVPEPNVRRKTASLAAICVYERGAVQEREAIFHEASQPLGEAVSPRSAFRLHMVSS